MMPTPRMDALVRELQRIDAPDWTIDLIAKGQELERELAAATARAAEARALIGECKEQIERLREPVQGEGLTLPEPTYQDCLDTYTLEDLATWLDRKYQRHGEHCDRLAAKAIRDFRAALRAPEGVALDSDAARFRWIADTGSDADLPDEFHEAWRMGPEEFRAYIDRKLAAESPPATEHAPK